MHMFMYNVDFIGHFAFVIIENDLLELTCQKHSRWPPYGIPGPIFSNISESQIETQTLI